MATLNDFKLVNNKSKEYFRYLKPAKQVGENPQKRIGFYYLVIESVSSIKDIEEISNCINDTEFCNLVLGMKNNDEGVDAVTVDNENKVINLYNFKFKDKFNRSSGQKVNDAADSMKFLSHINNEDTAALSPRTKAFADQIIDLLNSDEIWGMNLYLVSNENNSLPVNDPAIKSFQKLHDLNVESINLNSIVDFMSKRPADINATLFLNSSSVMAYEEDNLSSSKSYLVEITLLDLIRITCTDKKIRDDFHLDEMSTLADVKLDFGLLFDNVRGFLGETRFNKNIVATLQTEPSKFFMYNNGITMTAKNIQAEPKNGNKKLLVTIQGYQIVNGGQTLRSIYNFKNADFNEEKLSAANILLRIFQTQDNDALTSSIAEFTNSQNAISAVDLKSVNGLQIQIEHFLKEKSILYVRKVGDTGDGDVEYKYRISMERLAQILYSKMGFPDRATNQKRRLFEKYYDEIFTNDLDFNMIAKYTDEYTEIQKTYSLLGVPGYEQKYFYILYLNTRNNDSASNINILERALLLYRSGEKISDARKLIQGAFKEELEKRYPKNGNWRDY